MITENYDSIQIDKFNKTIFYRLRGKLHRNNGPAIIYSSSRSYYLYGKYYHEEDYFKMLNNKIKMPNYFNEISL